MYGAACGAVCGAVCGPEGWCGMQAAASTPRETAPGYRAAAAHSNAGRNPNRDAGLRRVLEPRFLEARWLEPGSPEAVSWKLCRESRLVEAGVVGADFVGAEVTGSRKKPEPVQGGAYTGSGKANLPEGEIRIVIARPLRQRSDRSSMYGSMPQSFQYKASKKGVSPTSPAAKDCNYAKQPVVYETHTTGRGPPCFSARAAAM